MGDCGKENILDRENEKEYNDFDNDDENNHKKSVIFTSWRGVPT